MLSFGIRSASALVKNTADVIRTDLPCLVSSGQSIGHLGRERSNEFMACVIAPATWRYSLRSAGPRCRLCCLDFHGVDVRHTTRSAFKDIIDRNVLKSRRSTERHNLSAAWAMRRPWRVFTRMFVAHGRQRSLNRKCPPTPPACIWSRQ